VARAGAKKSRLTCEAQTGTRRQDMAERVRAVGGPRAPASFRACIALLKAAQRERQPGRALDAFLITLRPAALNVIRRHVPPPRDEDLAQELLLWVSKAYRRIQPERCPGYLLTAAYNLARREHKGYPLGAVLLTASAEPLDACRDLVVTESPAEALEAAERLELIHRAVFALPTADLRDAAIGVYILDCEPAALAEQLGITHEALRQRLKRARSALRLSLASLRHERQGSPVVSPKRRTRARHADPHAPPACPSCGAPSPEGTV